MSENKDLAGIEFIDEGERLHFAQAQLGHEALMFLRSNVGKYLHGRAQLQVTEAKEAVLECNPDSFFGRRKIKRLQNEAAQGLAFIRWCTDIITEGAFSTQELENYRGNKS
jgi:hypothetical protein